MSINMSSITKKVADYAKSEKGKSVINDTIKKYREEGKTTVSGSNVFPPNPPVIINLVNDLIDLLKSFSATKFVPLSVRDHFDSLTYKIQDLGAEGVVCYIYFQDDLSRPSLYEKAYPDGVENIVALFNTGYVSSSPVYGEWVGHTATSESAEKRSYSSMYGVMIQSLQMRQTVGFMQTAIDVFNLRYKNKYNFTVILDEIYSDGSYHVEKPFVF